MAAWARDHLADPEIRALACDIETAQTAQIGTMQGWLTLWNASLTPPGRYMTWMADQPTTHSHGAPVAEAAGAAVMPGMAIAEELARLRAAAGRDLEVRFLQLMLRHHEGGTAMLMYAVQQADVGAVRTIAERMATAQGYEITYLRALLADRDASPLPL